MQRGVWAGEKLKALLKERGMTQEQLALAAGLRRTDVNRYVNDRQRLGEINARKLAEALSVTPEYLGLTESEATVHGRLERIEPRLDAIERRLAG